MKIILKLIFAAIFFLFCDTTVIAQDEGVDSAAEKTGDLTEPETLGDTVLNRYRFEAQDSLQEYKRDRDFAYMKYLDSILRQTKDLTVDTFSVASATSSRNARESRQRSQPADTTRQVNVFGNPVVKIILWIAAAFLIGFIIYKLFLGENFFRRDRSSKNISDTQKDDEDLADASAYDSLIAKAVRDGNYRLAIRYSYLQTLQKLSGSGLVQFSADKTNYQYVNELRGKPYQDDFAAITLNYEYVWYGKFDINENVYSRLSGEYKSFHQKI